MFPQGGRSWVRWELGVLRRINGWKFFLNKRPRTKARVGEFWFAIARSLPPQPDLVFYFFRNRRAIQTEGIAGLVGYKIGVRELHLNTNLSNTKCCVALTQITSQDPSKVQDYMRGESRLKTHEVEEGQPIAERWATRSRATRSRLENQGGSSSAA